MYIIYAHEVFILITQKCIRKEKKEQKRFFFKDTVSNSLYLSVKSKLKQNTGVLSREVPTRFKYL